jgi:hypothetical protein
MVTDNEFLRIYWLLITNIYEFTNLCWLKMIAQIIKMITPILFVACLLQHCAQAQLPI